MFFRTDVTFFIKITPNCQLFNYILCEYGRILTLALERRSPTRQVVKTARKGAGS